MMKMKRRRVENGMIGGHGVLCIGIASSDSIFLLKK
jgi:hypothetical protein